MPSDVPVEGSKVGAMENLEQRLSPTTGLGKWDVREFPDVGRQEIMRKLSMLTAGLVVALGLSFIAVGVAPGGERTAQAQQGAAITIDQFQYNPAELAAKVSQPITITNNDDVPHTVTAEDGTFDVEVPAKGNATVTVPKAGSFPYTCTLHPGQHNAASIKTS
jgi:plastocyanin